MRLILHKKSFFIFLFFLFFTLCCSAQTFVGPGTDWNTASNWSPTGLPSNSISGTIIINANVNVASITVKNGGKLIVNSPAILTVGTVGNSAGTQVVDFQNGSNVTVNTGASMKVYGKLNNSNNSNNVKFDGTVSVDGNVEVGSGSTITGSGSLSSTGSVSGSGTVFGTTDDCTSGCNYSCSSTAPTGITGSTTICNGGSTTLILSGGTVGTGATAKWYSGSCGGTLVGTGNSVSVSPTTTTTYYVRYEGTCNTTSCASTTVSVNPVLPASVGIAITSGTQVSCSGTSVTFTATPTNGGTTPTYQWTKNGTNIGGATSVTYTGVSGTAFVSTDIIRCLMTSNATPCLTGSPATSPGLTMTVNPTPTLSGASQAAAVCAGSGATINLTGLLPNSTSTINYTINGSAQTPITGVVANASGSASFTSAILVAANNGQYLQLSSITTTSTTPNCSINVYNGFNLQVNFSSIPTNTRSDNVNWCTSTIRWDGSATNFYLDVATSNTFSVGTILSAYNNLNVGNVNSLVLSGLSPNTTYYFRLRRQDACGLSGNSDVANFTTMTISAPTANAGYASCNDWVAQWNKIYNTSGNGADGYYLDVAIDNSFTNYVSGYQNLYVGDVNAYTITGLARGGVYYYRVRANTSCGVGSNSNVVTFTEIGNGSSNPGTISGGAASVCVGSSTPAFTNSGSNPSSGVWSVFNQTGSAAITSGGVVNGVSPGNVLVVFTTYNGGCGVSTSQLLTINVGGTVSVASSSPTTCVNTAITTITHATSNFTGISNNGILGANGLPSGVSAIFNSNTITINGTPTVSGTFNYSIPLTGGCSGIYATGTIIANPLPSTPVLGTVTQPTCAVPTGSVALSGLPVSGSIVQTGSSNAIYTITGFSQTIAGLASGNYDFAVSNGSCTSSTVSVSIVYNVETNTYSASGWSKGSLPTSEQKVIFTKDFSSSSDISACSCQITGGANVVINSANTLIVTNSVDVTSGSLIFENNASLVQVNDAAVNSGSIIYKRNTALVNRYDFTYWSSPVAGQTLKNLSPYTFFDKYYSYDNGWKVSNYGALTMIAGEGYSVRAPQSYAIKGNPQSFSASFEGIPNNGKVEKTVEEDETVLLGNPYPSAIDADEFLKVNSAILGGTLYFWTHNTPPAKGVVGGDATYSYTSSDYASYNRTGGVGNVTTGGAIPTGGVAPIGKIAAGQGFFAVAIGNGKVEFKNSMRVGGGASGENNSQFFKLNTSSKATTATTTTVAATEKNRIWLNLTNTQGAFKQMLVGYITGATNDYDNGFDGVTYDGNLYVDFYSVNQEVNLSIQGRALPFVKKDSVVLGYKSKIVGDFQISIDHTDGALATQNVFLEDKDLQVLHDLKKESYTFTTEKGVFNNRFVLRYVDKNAPEEVVEPEVPVVTNKEVVVSIKEGVVKINSLGELLDRVIVYDIAGRKIYQKNELVTNVHSIQHLIATHQVVLVDVVLANGTKVSRKIIY